MSTETQRPPVPAGDYLLFHDGHYASYGPRVEHDGIIGPPEGDEPIQFWGVYSRSADGESWVWYADTPTRSQAHCVAEAALFAVLQ